MVLDEDTKRIVMVLRHAKVIIKPRFQRSIDWWLVPVPAIAEVPLPNRGGKRE